MAAGAVPTLLCCQSGATPGHPGHAATTVPNRTHCTGIFDVGVSPAPTLPITHRRGQRLEDTLCSLVSLVPLSLPLTEMFDWMVDGGMMLLYLWKNSELLGFMIRFYWAENGLNVLSLQEIWDLFWSQVLALHNPLLHPRKRDSTCGKHAGLEVPASGLRAYSPPAGCVILSKHSSTLWSLLPMSSACFLSMEKL